MPRQVYYAKPAKIRFTRFADRREDVECAKPSPFTPTGIALCGELATFRQQFGDLYMSAR